MENKQYPFEELKDILNEYILSPNSPSLIIALNRSIEKFIYDIAHRYYLSDIERNMLHITTNVDNDTLNVKCGNLFTACILYNHYIPYMFINPNDYEYEFKNGDIIEFNKTLNEYMLTLSLWMDSLIVDVFIKYPLEHFILFLQDCDKEYRDYIHELIMEQIIPEEDFPEDTTSKLNYFESVEEYEKCTSIQSILKNTPNKN